MVVNWGLHAMEQILLPSLYILTKSALVGWGHSKVDFEERTRKSSSAQIKSHGRNY